MERRYARYRWDDVEEEEVTQSLRRRVVCGNAIMLVRITLDEGHCVPSHSHANDQMTWVLDGALRFWVGSEDAETVDLAAGDVLHVPGQTIHRVEALKDAIVLDVFSPPRRDVLEGIA